MQTKVLNSSNNKGRQPVKTIYAHVVKQ